MENWYFIVLIIAVIVVASYYIKKFFNKPSDEQLKKVKEWLLYAVTKAEAKFGSKTGKLKLRYVYDLFLTKFTWIAMVISFDEFSDLVDAALKEMREILEKMKLFMNS